MSVFYLDAKMSANAAKLLKDAEKWVEDNKVRSSPEAAAIAYLCERVAALEERVTQAEVDRG